MNTIRRISSSFDCKEDNCENEGQCPKYKSHVNRNNIRMENASYVPPVVSCVCPKGFDGHFCERSLGQIGTKQWHRKKFHLRFQIFFSEICTA